MINATEIRRPSDTATPYADSPPRGAYSRPVLSRVPTFEGPTKLRQEPAPSQWIQQRAASENLGGFSRGSGRISADPYADSEEASSYGRSSPERFTGGRSISPATSHGSMRSRQPSATNMSTLASLGSRKAPPPPPPSRSKKPPPPPPMKRTLFATPDA